MQESSPSPHQHYPFENVQSPSPSSSHHAHHIRRDDGREIQDVSGLRLADGLTKKLSEWGFLAPECEGRSQTRQSFSDQDSPGLSTAFNSKGSFQDSSKPAQAQKVATENSQSERASFTEEYGKFVKVLHYDSTSTVQLYEKKAPVSVSEFSKPRQGSTFTRLRRASMPKPMIRELYAVKMFHNTKSISKDESHDSGVGSEPFSLSHPNILSILDILYNKQGNLCLVMPYCTGGNLHTFLEQEAKSKSDLTLGEINCFGIQILRAIAFLHERGIAHGDLQPQHILLTARGAAKVGGFGEDEDAVRELTHYSYNDKRRESRSGSSAGKAPTSNSKLRLCVRRSVSEYSTPYLPPERFSSRRDSVRQGYTHQQLYDIRAGDMWACGMIYMILRSGRLPWRSARGVNPDKSYAEYLHWRLKDDGFAPIQVFETHCRNVIYAMLHPDPNLRITAEEVLRSEWVFGTAVCEVGEMGL
ncbi:kinase-like domain-containing protein [Penicillium sp. IBT 18751x]|nr:kinase-like domain-containing protein [Penicillium sp. IBT 18751x]